MGEFPYPREVHGEGVIAGGGESVEDAIGGRVRFEGYPLFGAVFAWAPHPAGTGFLDITVSGGVLIANDRHATEEGARNAARLAFRLHWSEDTGMAIDAAAYPYHLWTDGMCELLTQKPATPRAGQDAPAVIPLERDPHVSALPISWHEATICPGPRPDGRRSGDR
jgi:hypothetical protein